MYYDVEWKICINFKIKMGLQRIFIPVRFSHNLGTPQTTRGMYLQASFIKSTLVDKFSAVLIYTNLI